MGTFGNNFGNNWSQFSGEIDNMSGHTQQLLPPPQPFVTVFSNLIQVATAQAYQNHIKYDCLCDCYNTIRFQLSMLRSGRISRRTVNIFHTGRLRFFTVMKKSNTFKMSLSAYTTNKIFLGTLLSEFIRSKFDKVKKIKTIAKMLDILSIGTAAETTRVVYRLEFDHEKEDECDDYDGEEYDIDDPDIPILPLHPNCKCYWEDADTNEVLGQDLGDLGTNLSTDF